jgi:hypothetical protein
VGLEKRKISRVFLYALRAAARGKRRRDAGAANLSPI